MMLLHSTFILSVTTLFALSVTAISAKDQIRTRVEVNMDNIIKRKDDLNLESDVEVEGKEDHNDTHPHPFYRARVVDNVFHSYRKYREMIVVKGGTFWQGTNDPYSTTGEYPLRQIKVKSFMMDAYPTINADYWAFRAKKRFVKSEAEKKGWSWVVDLFVSSETRTHYSMPGAEGWLAVKKAKWDAPEGPDSNLEDRWLHPVVHVSWHDAKKYCEFHGKRLPTEQEWEFAARAGAVNYAYPWGDNWERKRANLWQGAWPRENRGADGYKMTSPVDAYRPQNILGFRDMLGNVWEWTSSAYVERGQVLTIESSILQPNLVVMKGGSYVDSIRGDINLPVRNGQRLGQKQTYTASNVGFRCAKSAPMHDIKLKNPVKEKITTTSAPPRGRLHRRKDEL